MKTIYLDHNVIHYFSWRFPNSIDAAAEINALKAARADSQCKFVLSPSSIYEAASGNNKDCIEATAKFIDSLDFWFIPDHPVLAKRELRRHVLRVYFGENVSVESPFATSYTQHLVDVGISNISVGKYTPAGMIRHYAKHPHGQLDAVNQQRMTRPEILQQLQKAKAEGEFDAEMERRVAYDYFMLHFPERTFDGTWIPKEKKDAIIPELIRNQKEVFRECPTIWVDSLLSDARIENPARKPQLGDAIDIMHMGSALAYCSAFVSNDGYTRTVACRVANTAETGCEVVSLLSALYPV